MSNITIFKDNSGIFHVRALEINGEPWFIAKDVCETLELGNPSQAISRLDEDEKNTIILNEGIGNPEKSIVNEPGLYSLILGSRKPEAKQFKRWITHEVIPQIRKTGTYSLQPKLPQNMAEALRLAADLWEENQTLLPKGQAYDQFMSAQNSMTMGEVAKTLRIGRNTLFALLKGKGILMKNNVPYQEYMKRGYFEVIFKPISMGDDSINKPQTLVTSKGVEYIGKILEEVRV